LHVRQISSANSTLRVVKDNTHVAGAPARRFAGEWSKLFPALSEKINNKNI
jgi:hypothetical protein